MNSAHDLGGMHGFGPVEREENEPVFHEDWEATVFGISMLTGAQGLRGSTHVFRFQSERMGNAEYLTTSYYEKWLVALTDLLVARGIVTPDELAARIEAVQRGPDAYEPAGVENTQLEALATALVERGFASEARAVDHEPRFAVGHPVLTSRDQPRGHTRLPRYARGRRGIVVRHYGGYVFADTNAHGLGDCPDHVYNVRFDAEELWGESAEGRGFVHLDLWESYLREP